MLKVNGISTYYGKVQALDDITIEVGADEIISIIGANGAGKSTLMKSVMGIIKPRQGAILFESENLLRLRAHQVVKRGVVYVPEGRDIFPDLTVEDNLEMGAYSKRFSKKEMDELKEEMYAMFPILKERRRQMAGTMSGGQQQMVAIARGLMSNPKLIMFDEPSLGLAPVIVDEVFDTIVRINKEKKIPVVLVEQNAFMALSISNRCYILENGRMKKHGKSSELLHDKAVKAAYLGG